MKRYKSILIFAALLFAGFAPQANAEEITPRFSITVDPDQSVVNYFDVYHGETVLFEVTFKRPSNETMTFFWQEQGMGDSYWSERCTTVGDGVYRAVFRPEMDSGAKVFNCFIGRPGMIYRAVFQLRMKQSPGATPGALPLPVKTIDFEQIKVENAPYYTKEQTESVVGSIIGDTVTKEYIEKLGISGGGSGSTDGQAVTNIVDGIVSEKLAHVPNDTHLHHIEDLKGFTDFSNSMRSKLDLTVYASTIPRIGCISYFDGGDGSKIARRGEVLGHDSSHVSISYFCDALKTKYTTIEHDYWSGEATSVTIDGVMIVVVRDLMFGIEPTETDDELSTKSYVDGLVSHEKENIIAMIEEAVKDVKASAVNLEDKALGRKWELTANDGVFTFTLIEEPEQ